jgi:hypothetical protein
MQMKVYITPRLLQMKVFKMNYSNALIDAILAGREFSSVRINDGFNERYLMNSNTWLVY